MWVRGDEAGKGWGRGGPGRRRRRPSPALATGAAVPRPPSPPAPLSLACPRHRRRHPADPQPHHPLSFQACYWTGYFSTRPATKRLVRAASAALAAARQLEAVVGIARGGGATTTPLARAVALMQHHDAITGTDKIHVNQDYRKIVSQGRAEW